MLILNSQNNYIDMMKIQRGDNIFIEGVCEIRQPKLSEISEIGLMGYYDAVKFLSTTSSNIDEFYEIKSDALISLFENIMNNGKTRQSLHNLLSFFIVGNIKVYRDGFGIENDKGEQIGVIVDQTFDIIKTILLQILYLSSKSVETDNDAKPANSKAQSIMEKFAIGRKKTQEVKARDKSNTTTIDDVISAVCARHSSYNYFNIWDLTVWQLYDQYLRLIGVDRFYLEGMSLSMGGEFKDKSYRTPHWSQKINN